MAVFYRDLQSKELVYVFDDLVDEEGQKQIFMQRKVYIDDGLFITKDGKIHWRVENILATNISLKS